MTEKDVLQDKRLEEMCNNICLSIDEAIKSDPAMKYNSKIRKVESGGSIVSIVVEMPKDIKVILMPSNNGFFIKTYRGSSYKNDFKTFEKIGFCEENENCVSDFVYTLFSSLS